VRKPAPVETPAAGEAQAARWATRPKLASLTNEEARLYYNYKLDTSLTRIVQRIESQGASRQAIAERISDLRNVLKIRTMTFMADQAAAARLPAMRPFEYYVQKYTVQGFQGDALWNRIIKGALPPNPEVNAMFGIK